MPKITIIVISGLLVCIGCAAKQSHQTVTPANIDSQTGNLIAFWLDYKSGEKAVIVTEPYAVLMVWQGDEKHFYVYDNKAKKTYIMSNFEAFLEKIKQLPNGIEIQRFDTCSASQVCDMPTEEWQRLTQVLRAGGRKWATSKINGLDHEVVCTCLSTGRRYP